MVEAVNQDTGGLLVHHRFGEEVKHRTKNGIALVKEARGTGLFDTLYVSDMERGTHATSVRKYGVYDQFYSLWRWPHQKKNTHTYAYTVYLTLSSNVQ